jgi:hypothetical protein
MEHVGELYSYALLPLVALGLGTAVSELVRRASFVARVGVVSFTVLVFAGNAMALRHNVQGMAESGRRSAALMNALVAEVQALQPGARMLLVDPIPALPEYSVYRMTNFRLVREDKVRELAGRNDVTIEVGAWGEATEVESYDAVFTLTEGSVLERLD